MNDATLNEQIRPLLEALGPSGHAALRAAGDAVGAWHSWVEDDGSIGSLWSLAANVGSFARMTEAGVCLPFSSRSVLEAACEVARARGWNVRGWHWDTLVGERAWLVADPGEEGELAGRGAVHLCFVEVAVPETAWTVPLLVLRAAEDLRPPAGEERRGVGERRSGARRENGRSTDD